jgi:hypothetical protein
LKFSTLAHLPNPAGSSPWPASSNAILLFYTLSTPSVLFYTGKTTKQKVLLNLLLYLTMHFELHTWWGPIRSLVGVFFRGLGKQDLYIFHRTTWCHVLVYMVKPPEWSQLTCWPSHTASICFLMFDIFGLETLRVTVEKDNYSQDTITPWWWHSVSVSFCGSPQSGFCFLFVVLFLFFSWKDWVDKKPWH